MLCFCLTTEHTEYTENVEDTKLWLWRVGPQMAQMKRGLRREKTLFKKQDFDG